MSEQIGSETYSFKALRQVVDSTVGDVVQLVRTLPRRWSESHTVTEQLRTIPVVHTGVRQVAQQFLPVSPMDLESTEKSNGSNKPRLPS